LDLLNKREGNLVGTKSISFDTAFFDVPKPAEEVKNESENLNTTLKTSSWNVTSHTQDVPHSNIAHSYTENNIRPSNPTTPFSSENSHTEVRKAVSFIKDNQKDIKDKRQQTIIALVKKHRILTIKGFTGVIKGCSEKTIQRELLALVANGVLKKEGERRWSTYSLA